MKSTVEMLHSRYPHKKADKAPWMDGTPTGNDVVLFAEEQCSNVPVNERTPPLHSFPSAVPSLSSPPSTVQSPSCYAPNHHHCHSSTPHSPGRSSSVDNDGGGFVLSPPPSSSPIPSSSLLSSTSGNRRYHSSSQSTPSPSLPSSSHCHRSSVSSLSWSVFSSRPFRNPFPSLLSQIVLIFIFIILSGPLEVSGQVYSDIRRQYWLMCPAAGGNATINVTCQGAPEFGADLMKTSTSEKGRGPVIRIVELRAHLISDQKAWMGFGPRSCTWTQELNKSIAEVAMASLGSLPIPVDPEDNVSDMFLKNCQAQTYCLSTDSKSINARQFSQTFKAIPEAGVVFHDSASQMKLPVVLELGYICTSNPQVATDTNQMCSNAKKNGSTTDIPVEYGSTTTTWLWSPNYQKGDTPSDTSCECILRTSSPNINVTIIAYHVRSWNSATTGFRNVINQRILTMYDNSCTQNSFENDPCVPARCQNITLDGNTAQFPATTRELRLSSECLFPPGYAPKDRKYYMRRAWFAIETSVKSSWRSWHMRQLRHANSGKRQRRQEGNYDDYQEGDMAYGTGNPGADYAGDPANPAYEDYTFPTYDQGGQEYYGPSYDGGAGTTPSYESDYMGATTGAPEYYDYEEPVSDAPLPSITYDSNTPKVTVTCYNYARSTPPTGEQRGGASASLFGKTPRLELFWFANSFNSQNPAFFIQAIAILLQNASILFLALLAYVVC